ncbi:organic cation transporter protein-like isoform X1 [Strongylocentrotus purpuratus]|uniref:Major facilitator superfamily (MFS) profile domain-containing protein n=1 Tax=Strongylocentrotus purpuratus TaxID=7668 RepID=A0A7M7PGS3_STRPU|nr:organic cation transporter protein-like isoform X1 [Strongylocentrotus purpuratus]
MAFDDILLTLGEFGTYQKITFALVFMFWFPAAANVLAVVFLAGSSDHWCQVSEWNNADCTGLGLNESDCAFYKKYLSIPHSVADDDTIVYDQCHKYDVSQVSFSDAMAYFLENTNQSGSRYDFMSCDQGWVHDRALSAYTLTQSFDLVCDRKYLINLSQSIFFIGVLIGSLLFGAISDRYGRKITLIISNVLVVVFGVGAAFSPNYITFVVLRAFQAAGCYGMLLISMVIGTEFVGPSRRAFVAIFISVSFSLGYLLLTFYAYLIRNWRYLLLTLNMTFALFFFFYPFIPESVRWQISKGRYKRAEISIRKVAKINKVKLTDDFFQQTNFYNSKDRQGDKKHDTNLTDLFRTPVLRKRMMVMIVIWYRVCRSVETCVCQRHVDSCVPVRIYSTHFLRLFDQQLAPSSPSTSFDLCPLLLLLPETTNPERNHDPNLIDLFRTPVLRKRMIVLIIVWMTNNLIFYGLHLSTGSFGVNIYLSFLISAVVEVVAMIICVPVIERVGRRYSLIACLTISGIASCIAIFIPVGAAKTGVAMVGKFGIAGSWAVGLIYPFEILPTVTRNVGIGICSSASRVVAIATPLMLLLYDVWAPGPLVLQTIAALVTAALCLILPETRGKKLPETLEDGETFGIKTIEDRHSMEKLPTKL